jgi:hypothetical protein
MRTSARDGVPRSSAKVKRKYSRHVRLALHALALVTVQEHAVLVDTHRVPGPGFHFMASGLNQLPSHFRNVEHMHVVEGFGHFVIPATIDPHLQVVPPHCLAVKCFMCMVAYPLL